MLITIARSGIKAYIYDVFALVKENWHTPLFRQSIRIVRTLAKILGEYIDTEPRELHTRPHTHTPVIYMATVRVLMPRYSPAGEEFRVFVPEILPLLLTSLLNDARGTGSISTQDLPRNSSLANLKESSVELILRTRPIHLLIVRVCVCVCACLEMPCVHCWFNGQQ